MGHLIISADTFGRPELGLSITLPVSLNFLTTFATGLPPGHQPDQLVLVTRSQTSGLTKWVPTGLGEGLCWRCEASLLLGLDCIQGVLVQQSSQWTVAQAHWCSRHGNPENKCGDEDAPQ